MKISSWLTRLSNRRVVQRTNRIAEVFEPRSMMDATLFGLAAQGGGGVNGGDGSGEEVTAMSDDGEFNPDVIFYSLGGAANTPPISQFSSREELGEYLLQRALARYDGLFGQAAWWYQGPIYFRSGGFLAAEAAPAFLDHSETNTQVDGVDEADVIENDGSHLFVLNNNELVILQAYPAGQMRELSRVSFEGNAIAEYLDGTRLTVISQEYSYGGGDFPLGFYGASAIRFAPTSVTTVVSVLDVSNPSKPNLTKQVRLDGSYVDSRAIDGHVHVITSNDLALPAPQTDGTTTIDVPVYYYDPPVFIADDVVSGDSLTIRAADDVAVEEFAEPDVVKTQQIEVPVYESRDAYIARVRATLDSLIDAALPRYEGESANGLAATGLISEISAISRVTDAASDSLLSVVSIDMRSADAGLDSSSSVIADWTNGIYANRDHLYVFSPIYGEGATQTRILEFAWANEAREIQLIGSGVVDGTLLNQFSADEHDGRLRIATTSSQFNWETGVFSQSNNLIVLENVGGTLSEVGSVTGFADGERIYSVRYDGDRAFIVTFRQVDPLFVFDLSDPAAPTIVGELQVPGFSSYLQVIDANHLLAVGRDTDSQSTKVSLYDISNPSAPTEVDSDSLPHWTWSQAEWDSKAVGWFDSRDTLAIPTSGWDDESGYHNELTVFHVDVTQSGEDAIQQTGSVEDDGYIHRSSYIGNVLYTISNNSVIATDINNPSQVIGQVDFVANPYLAVLRIEPVFTETDDGAADWEYLDPPDSLDEAEGMLSLAAVNVLDGTVRVSLLDAANAVNATLQNNTLTVKARGHKTEVVTLNDVPALLIEGTAEADTVNLTLNGTRRSALETITVNTGDGNDRVQVLAVNSGFNSQVVINGEAGNDRVNIADPVRTAFQINGGDGQDSITGGAGNDTISGGAGNDSLSGARGNDLIHGDDGDDVLLGRDGNDTLSGGVGNDRIFGGEGRDAIAGSEGNDKLYGEGGNDTLLGGNGNDTLEGGAGEDIALGEDDDDVVDGGAGSRDILSGGSGRNRVLGSRREIHEAFVFRADWLDLI